jgi:hypothetical protein
MYKDTDIAEFVPGKPQDSENDPSPFCSKSGVWAWCGYGAEEENFCTKRIMFSKPHLLSKL